MRDSSDFVGGQRMVRIVSVSGGKDSTALYLWALEHERRFLPVFADTGNEAQQTYDYLHELPMKTGGPAIRWIKAYTEAVVERKARNLLRTFEETGKWGKGEKAVTVTRDKIEQALTVLKPTGNPFLDMSLSRGGFPSHDRRFCTDKLKIEPMCKQVYRPLVDSGCHVVSWQGVRADESPKRSVLPRRSREEAYGVEYHVFRPLLDWKEHEVFAFIRRHGLEPNPLYAMGASRVGCWPCIFSRKNELRNIAIHDPQKVEILAGWEAKVSLATPSDQSTFFMARDLKIPGPFHHSTHGIRQKMEWSKTGRGGKQYELLFDAVGDQEAGASDVCSGHGMCE